MHTSTTTVKDGTTIYFTDKNLVRQLGVIARARPGFATVRISDRG